MKITAKDIALAKKNGVAAALYGDLVAQKIRTRYSQDAELATLRQLLTKPDEFTAYHVFAEECKAEAKRELGL